MSKTGKRSGVLALVLIITVVLTGIFAFLYMRIPDFESLNYPKLTGKVVNEEGKPIPNADILIVWTGKEVKGYWWFPLEREAFGQTYRQLYIRSDTSGGFSIGSWSIKQPRHSNLLAWSGGLELTVVSPGYRPTFLTSDKASMFDIERTGKAQANIYALRASTGRQGVTADTPVQMKPISSDSDAMVGAIQVEGIYIYGPATTETRVRNTQIGYEYFQAILKLFPNGPSSMATAEKIRSKNGDKYSVPLYALCKKVINSSQDPEEIHAARRWYEKVKLLEEES